MPAHGQLEVYELIRAELGHAAARVGEDVDEDEPPRRCGGREAGGAACPSEAASGSRYCARHQLPALVAPPRAA
jgi:hypothetical protein